MNLKNYIATIKNYPIAGVNFRDITPLMQNGDAFKEACDQIKNFATEAKADIIVGPESRGFIFGCPVAYEMGIGFVPVRKPGKLPRETVSFTYDLEYGSNELHIHADAIQPNQKVLIVDDLLATGGTVEATVKLIEELGGIVVGCAFLIELSDLNGRDKLVDYKVFSCMTSTEDEQ
ncbi:MAG: adenine phosphoribosyltransferase [Erysipelothrix sp.]|nr:adenine phosphoribosyltransferase [Erysipelothrix sp.]